MRRLLADLPGTAAVLLATFFWSFSALLAKMVTIDPLLLPGLRAVLAGLLLLPFFRPRRIHWSWRLPVLVVSFAMISAFVISAFRFTAAANATALYYSSPLWIFLVTSLLAKAVQKQSLLPSCLLLLGILIILAEPKLGSNHLGNVMGLCAGACFACYSYFYNAIPYAERLNHLALCNLCAGPLILLLALLLQPESFAGIAGYGAYEWGMLLVMAVTQLVIPYYLFSIGMAKLPLLRASMLTLGEFVLAPVWTLVFLNETPTVYGFAGWLFVFAGLLFSLLRSAREEAAAKKLRADQAGRFTAGQ